MNKNPTVKQVRTGTYTVRGPEISIRPGGTVITDLDGQETVLYPTNIHVVVETVVNHQITTGKIEIGKLIEDYTTYKEFFERNGGMNRSESK